MKYRVNIEYQERTYDRQSDARSWARQLLSVDVTFIVVTSRNKDTIVQVQGQNTTFATTQAAREWAIRILDAGIIWMSIDEVKA